MYKPYSERKRIIYTITSTNYVKCKIDFIEKELFSYSEVSENRLKLWTKNLIFYQDKRPEHKSRIDEILEKIREKEKEIRTKKQ